MAIDISSLNIDDRHALEIVKNSDRIERNGKSCEKLVVCNCGCG